MFSISSFTRPGLTPSPALSTGSTSAASTACGCRTSGTTGRRPILVFFLMIRRPPRSTQSRSSAASDVYKIQHQHDRCQRGRTDDPAEYPVLSLIHISEPTRLGMISYAVFCLKKKKKKEQNFVNQRKHNTKENKNQIKTQNN